MQYTLMKKMLGLPGGRLIRLFAGEYDAVQQHHRRQKRGKGPAATPEGVQGQATFQLAFCFPVHPVRAAIGGRRQDRD